MTTPAANVAIAHALSRLVDVGPTTIAVIRAVCAELRPHVIASGRHRGTEIAPDDVGAPPDAPWVHRWHEAHLP